MSSIDTISSMMETYGLGEASATSSGDDLGKDAFLNLLVTQMQYQDPLEPTSNEDFLAQMAQFSSLEQMQNINTSITMQQGYALVGKSVLGTFTNSVTGISEYVEGVVSAVTLKSGEAYLSVDGQDVALTDVQAVLDDSTEQAANFTEAIEEINASLEAITEKLDAIIAEDETVAEASETTETTTE